MSRLILIFFVLAISFSIAAQKNAQILRFPATNGKQVVFTHAGDLYTVPMEGGNAKKLTSHMGYEMFARFSPDGQTVAFSAQYDGNTEVYTMSAEGGIPERITYTATLNRDDVADRMGPNNIVMTWTPDGKNVVYRSRKESFNSFVGQLFVTPMDGMSEQLPLPAGGFCAYSQDGKKLAYNQIFREFRTWKYYEGGMADDVWIYDFDSKTTTNITNHKAQDICPMWYKDKVYYISDRDRTMNLFCYDLNTKETSKITSYTDYDIKFPSIFNNLIVFEKGGELHIHNIDENKTETIEVKIADDYVSGRNTWIDASKYITWYDLSPDGNRIVYGAHGDVFSLPATTGITRNLTSTAGYHEHHPIWSPDGKTIAFISDQSGEFEIYTVAQDGNGKAKQLTKNADTYKYFLVWSPDSKKILWSDKKLRLRYIDVESGKITEVDNSKIWEFTEFCWSNDSKWIAYVKMGENRLSQIHLYNVEKKISTPVTEKWYNSSQPKFSSDNKYLLLVSERDFNPIYNDLEWNHAYVNMSKIYLVPLQKDTPDPFAPVNDEVSIAQDDKKTEESNDYKEIETADMHSRLVAAPVRASNYWNISLNDDKLMYFENHEGSPTVFKCYDLKERKESELGSDIENYKVSADGKKMLLKKGGNKFYVIEFPKKEIKLKSEVDLSKMKVLTDYKEEWKQIYYETWRQMRDFFYAPNMHGTDWEAMKKKYEIFLPNIHHRNDLTYIMGELIGELNVGHAYVGGGDRPEVPKIKMGLLGAKISKAESGYFRIDKILKGQNWSDQLKSPLTAVGVNISEGDYIISVNGIDLKNVTNIYKVLINTAGAQTELTINSEPKTEGSHKEIVIPIDDESSLYYFNWVQDNIRKVDEATNGQVGYIHVPNMLSEGLNEFVKYYYPQLNKKALIIDDRGNGGGNISPMLIERLRREITRSNIARNSEIPGHTPREMVVGPKVLLINQYSASDGDLFPYSFKKHQIGKVIGVRSWGGVVGIRGSLPFIDKGTLNKPEFASYSSEESKWIIEGWGVDPDIEIRNDPAREFAGTDEQLNKAIEVILEELKTYNKNIPPVPEWPDKSK